MPGLGYGLYLRERERCRQRGTAFIRPVRNVSPRRHFWKTLDRVLTRLGWREVQ